MLPGSSLTGGSLSPLDRAAQQVPDRTTWYSMTCSAPGMTISASSAVGGATATHGAREVTSKKMAPVRRTVRSTSERISELMSRA